MRSGSMVRSGPIKLVAVAAAFLIVVAACGSSEGSADGDNQSGQQSSEGSGSAQSQVADDTDMSQSGSNDANVSADSEESSSDGESSGASTEESTGGGDCTDPVKIDFQLNWVRNYNQLPMTVADHEGYYKDACLDVTIVPGSGSSDTVLNVGSGAAQVGISDTIAIIQGQLKDLPVTGVGVEWTDSTFAIIVSDDALGDIDPSDFKLTDLYGLTQGAVTTGSPYLFWQALANEKGLDKSKLKEVSISAPGYAELVNGSVDYITNLAGAIPSVEAAGGHATAFLGSQFGLETYGMALFANNKWLADNGDAMTRFLRATAKAMVWSGENPEEAVDILSSYEGVTDGQLDAFEAVLPYWTDEGTETPEKYLQFDMDGVNATEQVLYEGGVESGSPKDLSDGWTTEYLPDPSSYLDN